jgi:hypothetical protein
VTISAEASSLIRKSSTIIKVDIGVQVPDGMVVDPRIEAEIRGIVQGWTMPVNQAAQAVLASLMESEGLRSPEAPTVTV